jgi:hypothetical protein
VTIILSVVTAEYAVQVSDRLLTQKVGNRYAPWDRASNKSIIMLARDGLVTMGLQRSGPYLRRDDGRMDRRRAVRGGRGRVSASAELRVAGRRIEAEPASP